MSLAPARRCLEDGAQVTIVGRSQNRLDGARDSLGAPPSLRTIVAGDQKSERLNAMAGRLPVGRIGQPSDIAAAMAFLMANTFTTGTVLHVEGERRREMF